jgi:hypothetical protein
MKIVKKISNSVVVYMFNDTDTVEITENGMKGPVRALDIKPDTHVIVEGVIEPDFFVGNAFTYVTSWVISNQEGYDEAWANRCDQTAQKQVKMVESISKSKMYSDIDVILPSGLATIQFRNENDRTNLSNVASGATALIISGTPGATMSYRTLDNTIQSVTALQMLGIAMEVLNTKQAITNAKWDHKDALQAFVDNNDYQSIVDHDVYAGW